MYLRGGLAALVLACSSETAPPAAPGVVALRRVSESQYRHTVEDLFGAGIEINGRFEPDMRRDGLLALGASSLAVTSAGFEQYYAIASSVATQALDAERRAHVVPCTPGDAKAYDAACTRQFVAKYGRLLYRRPLAESEITPRLELARRGAEQKADFYEGLELALVSLMTAPDFLFRIEVSELDPDARSTLRLDGYTKAARLSYLLWNTAPDEELLRAAQAGELHDEAGLRQQVRRLLESPRLEAGVRAFFTDVLRFELLSEVTKDAQLYPKFSSLVARSAQEQTLRTIVDHLLVQDADYRDLFTTRDTFVDRTLAAVYRTPYFFDAEWSRYTFPEDSERRGILSQTAFLSLFAHPGDSSPTKRGVAILEVFQCEVTPEPPANVDFSIVNDLGNPVLPTRRARLLAHSEEESCAGCHEKSDPLGLALEHFDAIGQIRRLENGHPVDVSVELAGEKYTGAAGLGAALREDPKVTRCLVEQLYGFAAGQTPADGDPFLDDLHRAFGQAQYRFEVLLEELVTHPDFYRVPPQPGQSKGQVVASAKPSS